MPENAITKIISGVIGLGLLIAVVYLIAVDRSEHVDTALAVGFAVLGAVNAALPSALPKGKGPRIPPLPVLMVCVLLIGCGATPRDHHARLNALTTVADPTYALAVEMCDVARDAIIARVGTTYAQDRAAMDRVHAVCDPMVLGFEALRGSQLTARAAIEGGASGAVAEAIAAALALWPQVQQLLRAIDSLGMEGGR